MAAIIQDITASLRDIVRLEMRLAVSEIRESIVNMRAGLMLAAVGAVAALYAVGVLILAAVYGLSLVVPAWAAALIVGAVLAAAGGGAIMLGMKRWSEVGLPRRTMTSVQETVDELRHELNRA
jgi:hypothetical protein